MEHVLCKKSLLKQVELGRNSREKKKKGQKMHNPRIQFLIQHITPSNPQRLELTWPWEKTF